MSFLRRHGDPRPGARRRRRCAGRDGVVVPTGRACCVRGPAPHWIHPQLAGESRVILGNHSQLASELRVVPRDHSQLAGELRVIPRNHSQLAGELRVIPGNHSQLAGELRVVLRDHSQLAGELRVVRGNHSQLAGELSVIRGNHSQLAGELRVLPRGSLSTRRRGVSDFVSPLAVPRPCVCICTLVFKASLGRARRVGALVPRPLGVAARAVPHQGLARQHREPPVQRPVALDVAGGARLSMGLGWGGFPNVFRCSAWGHCGGDHGLSHRDSDEVPTG